MNIKKIIPVFSDKRGDIIRVLNFDSTITSALIITSEKGAIRANHYHKKDMHYVYLVSGKFRYYEKTIESTSKRVSKIVSPGDLVKTSANIIHAMEFLSKSVMFVLTSEPRDPKKYEKDTVRVKLI